MKSIEFIKTLSEDKIFAGSYVLNKLGIIKRDFKDYDIILRLEEYEKIKSLNYEQLKGKYDFINNNGMKIISIIFDDNSECDLFFREDFEKLIISHYNDTYFGNIMFLDPIEIMYEKVNIIRQRKDIQKHLEDIKNIISYEENKALPF